MQYFWVNQNQTHRQEREGGFLWSPVRKANGARNPFYDYMRTVAPGDIVFCFYEQKVGALAIATSYCYDAPKPVEFGPTGENWSDWGHRVSVTYLGCPQTVRPMGHMDVIGPLLPARHSPLQSNGAGLQSIYLTSLPMELARVLLTLAGIEHAALLDRSRSTANAAHDPTGAMITEGIEEDQVAKIRRDTEIPEEHRAALVLARRGQGAFRDAVLQREPACRVTKIDLPAHLLTVHVRPWRACPSAAQRLDPDNGLSLAPHISHVFERGFLSFDDAGKVLVSPLLDPRVMSILGINPDQEVGTFRKEQCVYLAYHREHRLLRGAG